MAKSGVFPPILKYPPAELNFAGTCGMLWCVNNSNSAEGGISGERKILDPCTIVIFGASGDLTARKLIPALYLSLIHI